MRSSLLPLLAALLCGGQGAFAQTSSTGAPGPAQTNAAPPMREKGYVLGTNGSLGILYLKFPATWHDRIDHVTEKSRAFDAVYFTPTQESDFDFMVEIAMVGEEHNTNHAEFKATLRREAQNDLTNFAEKTIELKDFRGDQAVGSYFRVTDKKWALVSPPEGEAKYLTQGYASVGPLILTFHLYSNLPSKQEPAALEVLKTARYSKTTPPGMPPPKQPPAAH